jgi:hypothetical protein
MRRIALCLWAGLAFGCAGEAPDDLEPSAADDAAQDDRGPIGKADAAGTCALPGGGDKCGTKGVGACWCDELCVEYGDCCHDAGAVCGIDDGTDPPQVCSPVLCEIACPYGFETNDDGCEICACHDPTGDFCGGIAAIQCPQGFECQGVGNFPDASGQCVPVPEPEPEPDSGSCWDECGGPGSDGSDGSDGSCWCDDLCVSFGDCCDDYDAACVQPPAPTTCADCALGETCVTRFTQLGPEVSCVPTSPACGDGPATCACMGADVCTGVFDACSETEDGLGCSCPVC